MTDHQQLIGLIPQLADQRVLVIGDVFLDEYLIGTATRMSREAPIPVLEFESRRLIPGGAANPAANIAGLGSVAIQVGVVGEDDEATALKQVLRERNIITDALITDTKRPTTVKTRVLAQMGLRFPQQVARLDKLSREPIGSHIASQITTWVETHSASVNAVLCSDYRTGVLTPDLVESLKTYQCTLLTADAQGQLEKYRGFGVVKCNADEARGYLGRHLATDDDFATAASELCQRLDLTGGMVITRGAEGASLATATGDTEHVPAPEVSDVYDTVGAGDTTIAVLTLAVAAGADLVTATLLANVASGLVVRRVGNYAPSPTELRAALTP